MKVKYLQIVVICFHFSIFEPLETTEDISVVNEDKL